MTARNLTHSNFRLEQAFESSSQLRIYKTKLSRTASVLEHLANPQEGLGLLLKPADQAVLRQSIEVIQSVSLRVEQAKECKLQDEKALEQAFNARQAQSWKLTQAYFPLKHETLEQQAFGLSMAMSLNQIGLLKGGKPSAKFKTDLLELAKGLSQNYGPEYFFHELFSDCQQAIQEHIASPSIESVQEQLERLQSQVTAISPRQRESVEHFLSQLSVKGGPAHGSSARH